MNKKISQFSFFFYKILDLALNSSSLLYLFEIVIKVNVSFLAHIEIIFMKILCKMLNNFLNWSFPSIFCELIWIVSFIQRIKKHPWWRIVFCVVEFPFFIPTFSFCPWELCQRTRKQQAVLFAVLWWKTSQSLENFFIAHFFLPHCIEKYCQGFAFPNEDFSTTRFVQFH